MTREEIIDFCLSFGNTIQRYPYGEGVLVLSILPKKSFCHIQEGSDPLHITVKCDPFEADLLRQIYPCIKPGYHCNKKHWNSIYIDGTLSDDEIKRMITDSYNLVAKKNSKKNTTT